MNSTKPNEQICNYNELVAVIDTYKCLLEKNLSDIKNGDILKKICQEVCC
jgi:hypothetical protein